MSYPIVSGKVNFWQLKEKESALSPWICREKPNLEKVASMTTVFDVPAMELIEKVAGILKENENIVPPEWAKNVKTGVHKELPRQRWLVVYQIPLQSWEESTPTAYRNWKGSAQYTVGRKETVKTKPQSKRQRFRFARKAVQQLEAAGYLQKVKDGRTVSAKGRFHAWQRIQWVKAGLLEKIPELAKIAEKFHLKGPPENFLRIPF